MPVFTSLLAGTGNSAHNRAQIEAQLLAGGSDTFEFPKGTFYVDTGGCKATADGQRIFGRGQTATRIVPKGSGPLFSSDGKDRLHYAGFSLFAYGNHTGDAVFHNVSSGPEQGTPAQQQGCMYEDLQFEAAHSGIYSQDTNSSWIRRVSMINMRGDFGVAGVGQNVNNRQDLLRIDGLTYSAHPDALAANRGTGIIIDGFVHTMNFRDITMVRPYRGLIVLNSYGLPADKRPMFVEAHNFRVDYPVYEALLLGDVHDAYFNQSYFHGSQQSNNITVNSSCLGVKFQQTKISGAFGNGIMSNADDTELVGCDAPYNNVQNAGHSSIVFGPDAWTGRVIGGASKQGNQTYGIANWRGSGGFIQLSAADQHKGTVADKIGTFY